MRTAPRDLLVLTACVLLALPPGWCCILLPEPAQAAVMARADDCCRGCCAPPTPSQDAPPGRTPMKVCCCDNLIPLRKGAAQDTPDAPADLLPAVEVAPAPTGQPVSAAGKFLPPPRALHVLLCVWRC
jgi:hypothetical protein